MSPPQKQRFFPAVALIPKMLGILPAISGWILRYWKQVIIIGMAGIIFYQNFMSFEVLKWVGVRTIAGVTIEYQEKIGVINEQLNECELSRQLLTGEIELTNAQIDKWANVSSQLQTQHDSLKGELNKLRKNTNTAVTDILAGPTPKNCAESMRLLRDAVTGGELKWPGSE